MSAALCLTMALAAGHDCPTYSSQWYHYQTPTAGYASPGYGAGYYTPGTYGQQYAQPRYGQQHYGQYAQPSYDQQHIYGQQQLYGQQFYGQQQMPQQPYGFQHDPSRQMAGYAPPGPRQTVIQMTDRARFEPAQVTINVGDTVEWRNMSRHPHTVTADPRLAANPAHVVLPEGARPFDSGEIAPGSRFTHTFTVPGTYIYVCLPHEEMGMLGIVVVNEAQGQAQPRGGAQPPTQRRAY